MEIRASASGIVGFWDNWGLESFEIKEGVFLISYYSRSCGDVVLRVRGLVQKENCFHLSSCFFSLWHPFVAPNC